MLYYGRRMASLFAVALGGLSIGVARGDTIFVTNIASGTVGEYTTTGAVVNAALVSGLNIAEGIAVSGSNLFVATAGLPDAIGKYDANTGAAVNAALVSGLCGAAGIALSGPNLLVANFPVALLVNTTPPPGRW